MAALKYLLFTFISTCFLWQCATMQSPSGGEKDVLAPTVLKSNPAQGQINVRPTTIEIQFDEYFKLKNLQSELLISPPLETKPLISQKGKNLFIEILEDLKDDHTYTFNFGNGIVDFHEGNVLKDFSLVFSTGNHLDSMSISGKLNSCPVNVLPDNSVVAIYGKDSLRKDSTIFLQKPDYFGLLNEKGEYKIEYIRAGNYELIAFEDVNKNYVYDGATEQLAFCDSLISITDSAVLDLWLFSEKEELKLLDVLANKNGRIHWVYNQKIDSIKIHSNPKIEFYSKLKEDSLLVWPSYSSDSFYVWTEIYSRLDSVLVKTDTLEMNKLNISLKNTFLKSKSNLIIHSDGPIIAIDTAKIKLFSDSIPLEYLARYSDFELIMDFAHEGANDYNLILNDGAITSTYNNKNDSTKLRFYTKSSSQLASLKINVKTTKNYYIELMKDDKVLGRRFRDEELKFTELLATKYKLRLVVDENQDREWTAGNYFENRLPEKVFYYSEEINLRANWEMEIDFTLDD
tara:strand:- start:5825 stop:7369 length:1545 start_codon:yes stop_codon:yes gene_type:complete